MSFCLPLWTATPSPSPNTSSPISSLTVPLILHIGCLSAFTRLSYPALWLPPGSRNCLLDRGRWGLPHILSCFSQAFLPVICLWYVVNRPSREKLRCNPGFPCCSCLHPTLSHFPLSDLFQHSGEKGRKGERSVCKRNINRLPLPRPQLGTLPTTLACAPTWN